MIEVYCLSVLTVVVRFAMKILTKGRAVYRTQTLVVPATGYEKFIFGLRNLQNYWSRVLESVLPYVLVVVWLTPKILTKG